MGRLTEYLKKKINGKGRDLATFLGSLLLAFVLWTVQNLSLSYSSLISVSVSATSNLDGHARQSSNSSVIAARCRTTGFNHFSGSRTRKTIEVFFNPGDFSQVDDETFSISAVQLAGYVKDIFGDVELESFVSEAVQFRFPIENHKKVPVHPVFQASFRSQYAASSDIQVFPDSITIYGEPLHLDKIERVYTDNISLENLKSSQHGSAKLERITGVRFSDEIVNYSLEVTRYVEVKETIKIETRNVPSGKTLSIYPSTAEVVYKCAFPITSEPTGKVRFYIDWKDFSSSINGRCVARAAKLPDGVISYDLDPVVFEVMELGK